jgi:hypothetical protein
MNRANLVGIGIGVGVFAGLGHIFYEKRDILTSHTHVREIGYYQAIVKNRFPSLTKVNYIDTSKSVRVFGNACLLCGHVDVNRLIDRDERLESLDNENIACEHQPWIMFQDIQPHQNCKK